MAIFDEYDFNRKRLDKRRDANCNDSIIDLLGKIGEEVEKDDKGKFISRGDPFVRENDHRMGYDGPYRIMEW